MTDYTLSYTFKKVADNAWAVNYRCVDKDGIVVLAEREWIYKPMRRTFETNNEVRNALNALFGARKVTTWKLPGSMRTVCENPDSDFLSRSEMFRRTMLKRAKEASLVEEPKPVVSVVPTTNSDAVYEVVNKNGVWTIVKHEQPLLTAEQAKTVLFQKIVNG